MSFVESINITSNNLVIKIIKKNKKYKTKNIKKILRSNINKKPRGRPPKNPEENIIQDILPKTQDLEKIESNKIIDYTNFDFENSLYVFDNIINL